MKNYYIDKRTCIPYKRHGDCNLPDLKVSDQEHLPLGKFGRIRWTYLKENFPAKYNGMIWQDTLWPHLKQVDAEADDLFRTIVDQMAKTRGVNEQLKANDQWRWIQEMGNIRNAAEEVVLREIVYI